MTRLWSALLLPLVALLCACAQPEGPIEPDEAALQTRPKIDLRFIEGSTVKVEQLVGDTDRQTKQPTVNQTHSRYSIFGTDLGYSFEHNGRAFFLFGDTLGNTGGDVVGVSRSTNPLGPLALDFLTDAEGHYLRVEPPGVSMGGYEIPTSGISIDGEMYIAVKTNYTPRQATDYTLLTRYDEATRTFEPLRELSRMPSGRFITTSLAFAPGTLKGLPFAGPNVLIFGSGQYRRSNAFLSVVPSRDFESGAGTRYFAGLEANGKPIWSADELDSIPIIEHSTIGDISVQYIPELAIWVALYDSRNPRGIILRHADQPWGPWSAPQIVFEPIRDKAWGTYIHNPSAPSDIGGPVIAASGDAMRTQGGYYAPYLIERFTRVEGNRLTLHYVLSTWNPYVVVRMSSSLLVEKGKQASGPEELRPAAILHP